MNKLFYPTVAALLLIMAGCGSSSGSTPQTTEQPLPATTTTPSASPSAQPSSTSSPAGNSTADDTKGVKMAVVSATSHPEKLGKPIIFEINLENGSSSSLRVSSLDFFILTKNKEVIETTPGENSESRTVMPGGKVEGFHAAFELEKPEDVVALAYGNQKSDVFVQVPASEFPTLQVKGKAGEIKTEPATTGSVKADSVIFEESYLSYVHSLINAINEGDFSLVEPSLVFDSKLYEAQKNLVTNLSKQGTKEELIKAEILDFSFDDQNRVLTLTAREVVKIKPKDGEEKISENTWKYTAVQVDENIFQFSEISKS